MRINSGQIYYLSPYRYTNLTGISLKTIERQLRDEVVYRSLHNSQHHILLSLIIFPPTKQFPHPSRLGNAHKIRRLHRHLARKLYPTARVSHSHRCRMLQMVIFSSLLSPLRHFYSLAAAILSLNPLPVYRQIYVQYSTATPHTIYTHFNNNNKPSASQRSCAISYIASSLLHSLYCCFAANYYIRFVFQMLICCVQA